MAARTIHASAASPVSAKTLLALDLGVEDVLRAALPADRGSRFPTLVHRNGSSHRDAKELSQVNFPEHIGCVGHPPAFAAHEDRLMGRQVEEDRKSTRLNSSQ